MKDINSRQLATVALMKAPGLPRQHLLDQTLSKVQRVARKSLAILPDNLMTDTLRHIYQDVGDNIRPGPNFDCPRIMDEWSTDNDLSAHNEIRGIQWIR